MRKEITCSIVAAALIALGLNVDARPNERQAIMQDDGIVQMSENVSTVAPTSGLRPGYTLTQLPNTKPVPPGDKLPQMTATSAIVIEAKTGHVLYERDADKLMYPASTTKMMTLITALESNNLDEIVTVSDRASGAEGSTLWLEIGEKIPLGELLSGMILTSGNDAAIAVAEHVDGTVPEFAAHMTNRAHELGAVNTNFVNANGLPDENHYTTAHDLALMAAYGYTLDNFEDIVSAKEEYYPWVHDSTNKTLRSENQMLWLYEGGNGVKTGYTDAAGRCLVSAANRNGVQLIAVVLDSLYIWNDSIALLDYGFSKVGNEAIVRADETAATLPIVSGRKKTMKVKTVDELIMPTFKDDETAYNLEYDLPSFLRAPIKKGDAVGRVHVMCDGKEVAQTEVVATADVEQKSFFKMLLSFFGFENLI
ncbi:MAG: D-alanyl-D-alanine carboxypeptidase [Selenomonadaceae bacterium]|nr:D-alanyl-D-alanine carboxypeptidase [Selenomonadaceae bacterium]